MNTVFLIEVNTKTLILQLFVNNNNILLLCEQYNFQNKQKRKINTWIIVYCLKTHENIYLWTEFEFEFFPSRYSFMCTHLFFAFFILYNSCEVKRLESVSDTLVEFAHEFDPLKQNLNN